MQFLPSLQEPIMASMQISNYVEFNIFYTIICIFKKKKIFKFEEKHKNNNNLSKSDSLGNFISIKWMNK